jgi:hypothetical protein
MGDLRAQTLEAQKNAEPAHHPEREPANEHEQGPVQFVAPQAAYRRAQVSRDELTPAALLKLQRAAGNRQVQRMLARRGDNANMLAHELIHGAQQREGIQRQARPKKDETKKAQRPPPGGTIAEGGALNVATITTVKDALKKATTKRYIAY